MGVAVKELVVADPPEAWREAGFGVDHGVCRVGSVRLRLVGCDAGTGVVGWTLSGLPEGTTEVDGIPTSSGLATPLAGARDHSADGMPNAVVGIDHVVVMTPDVDRTVSSFAVLGLEARRERVGELGGAAVRQVFYRLGEVVVEVVGSPHAHGDGPATIWGITFTVDDIDAAAAYLSDRVGRVKDAVQPGRRITTLRTRDLGISTQIALISPHGRSR